MTDSKINLQVEILKFCDGQSRSIKDIFEYAKKIDPQWKTTKYGRDRLRHMVYDMRDSQWLWSSGASARLPFYKTTRKGREVIEAGG